MHIEVIVTLPVRPTNMFPYFTTQKRILFSVRTCSPNFSYRPYHECKVKHETFYPVSAFQLDLAIYTHTFSSMQTFFQIPSNKKCRLLKTGKTLWCLFMPVWLFFEHFHEIFWSGERVKRNRPYACVYNLCLACKFYRFPKGELIVLNWTFFGYPHTCLPLMFVELCAFPIDSMIQWIFSLFACTLGWLWLFVTLFSAVYPFSMRNGSNCVEICEKGRNYERRCKRFIVE